MSNRGLLLEFIQWCVDNPGLSEEIFENPQAATLAADRFLGDLVGVPAREPVYLSHPGDCPEDLPYDHQAGTARCVAGLGPF